MKTYEELLAERNGLSSQLLSLHRILLDARDCVRICHKQGFAGYKLLQTIDHALQKNSYEQCLAEIKADAIESVITEELYSRLKPLCGKNGVSEVEDYLTEKAAKARKGGEQ